MTPLADFDGSCPMAPPALLLTGHAHTSRTMALLLFLTAPVVSDRLGYFGYWVLGIFTRFSFLHPTLSPFFISIFLFLTQLKYPKYPTPFSHWFSVYSRSSQLGVGYFGYFRGRFGYFTGRFGYFWGGPRQRLPPAAAALQTTATNNNINININSPAVDPPHERSASHPALLAPIASFTHSPRQSANSDTTSMFIIDTCFTRFAVL